MKSNYSKAQRIGAIVGIALLLSLYIINFFLGLFCHADTFSLFLASLLATFFIPVLTFFYIQLMKHFRKEIDNSFDPFSGSEPKKDTESDSSSSDSSIDKK